MMCRCELCSLDVADRTETTIRCPRGEHRFVPADSIEEVNAAYAYVDEMVKYADIGNLGWAPAWYGWALRHAYLRGLRDGRK